jgi:ATP adenylyltransferase
MAYVSRRDEPPGCLLCRVQEANQDRQHGILTRSHSSFLILNAYPYASGHLMVATNRHVGSPEELTDPESLDLMQLCRRAVSALRAVYRPDGFNLGVNVGRVAGAGVDGHLHLHVVPRWAGDTSFMPVVGAVRVAPEALEDTYQRLHPHLGP